MRRIVRLCRRIAGTRRFLALTFAVILANAVVIGLQTYDSVEREAGFVLDKLNAIFLTFFVVELTIRITAYGARPWRFFRDGWNVFDFAMTVPVLIPGVRESTTALRVVRLLRVFRIVSALPEMRVLVSGLGRSVAPLLSMGVLVILLFYAYGMVGWILFSDHDPANWGSLGQAMLTLFALLTLEGWTEIQDTALQMSDWSWIYFVSFILVSSFVLINMVVAVLINGVEEARAAGVAERRALEHSDDVPLLQRLESLRQGIDDIERELLNRNGNERAAPAADKMSADG
jgi:voltage-gated sodium channel